MVYSNPLFLILLHQSCFSNFNITFLFFWISCKNKATFFILFQYNSCVCNIFNYFRVSYALLLSISPSPSHLNDNVGLLLGLENHLSIFFIFFGLFNTSLTTFSAVVISSKVEEPKIFELFFNLLHPFSQHAFLLIPLLFVHVQRTHH